MYLLRVNRRTIKCAKTKEWHLWQPWYDKVYQNKKQLLADLSDDTGYIDSTQQQWQIEMYDLTKVEPTKIAKTMSIQEVK